MFVMQRDNTHNVSVLYTDKGCNVISGTTPSGSDIWLGGDNVSTWYPDNVNYLYFAAFSGSAAEVPVPTVRKMFTAVGFNVSGVW